MDEENKTQADPMPENSCNEELELECLYKEVRKETEELKHLLVKHLEYLRQPRNLQWLTSNEVQNYLRVSKPTLKRYRDNHCLRYTFVYRRFRYSYEDILKIMKNSK